MYRSFNRNKEKNVGACVSTTTYNWWRPSDRRIDAYTVYRGSRTLTGCRLHRQMSHATPSSEDHASLMKPSTFYTPKETLMNLLSSAHRSTSSAHRSTSSTLSWTSTNETATRSEWRICYGEAASLWCLQQRQWTEETSPFDESWGWVPSTKIPGTFGEEAHRCRKYADVLLLRYCVLQQYYWCTEVLHFYSICTTLHLLLYYYDYFMHCSVSWLLYFMYCLTFYYYHDSCNYCIIVMIMLYFFIVMPMLYFDTCITAFYC